jgi:hypothetical protein
MAGPSFAQEKDTRTFDLAVYIPRLLFADNVARSLYAREVAATLSKASGLKISGRAFTRHSDLNNFINSGRVDLVLADIGLVAVNPRRYRVLASGTGPEGNVPAYAVMSYQSFTGIRALKGRRLGLPDATLNEVSLVSNIPLEGEVAVDHFFGAIRWAYDMGELMGWLKTGRVDCALGYAALARKQGLKIVSTLRGVPLPVLAVVSRRIQGASFSKLKKSIGQHGLDLPPHGLLTRLAPARLDLLSEMAKMAGLNPGERPAATSIWSPMHLERLPIGNYGVKSQHTVDLGTIRDRWRTPAYTDQ